MFNSHMGRERRGQIDRGRRAEMSSWSLLSAATKGGNCVEKKTGVEEVGREGREIAERFSTTSNSKEGGKIFPREEKGGTSQKDDPKEF